MPGKHELLAEYADNSVQEVFEFRMVPDMDFGGVDWESHSVLFGPKYSLESGAFGVRVTIAKLVPKAAVVSALKSMIDMLEVSDSFGDQPPPQLQSILKWFND
jgi:hypothetical protein